MVVSSSGFLNTGSSNIFLGYYAEYNETGSNKLYIENSNSTTPLLYGEFDTNILRTNGVFQIGNPITTGYALAIVDGTANQVITTDGSGTLSFQNTIVGTGAQEINDLRDAKTASRSVYLGSGSGNNDTSGDKQNSALGNNALYNSTSGIQNVAIGESTMLNNTSGERNVVVGQSAMRNNFYWKQKFCVR